MVKRLTSYWRIYNTFLFSLTVFRTCSKIGLNTNIVATATHNYPSKLESTVNSGALFHSFFYWSSFLTWYIHKWVYVLVCFLLYLFHRVNANIIRIKIIHFNVFVFVESNISILISGNLAHFSFFSYYWWKKNFSVCHLNY